MKALRWILPAVPLALLFPVPAAASLTTFATFVGNDRGSADGCRSASQPCLLSPGGPSGSSVLGGYLYSIFAGSFNQGGSISSVDYSKASYRHGDYASLVSPILGGDGPYNFTMTERDDSDNGNGVSSGFQGLTAGGYGGGGGGGGGGIAGGRFQGFNASGSGDIGSGNELNELKVGDGYSADGSSDHGPLVDGWNYEPFTWQDNSIVPSVKAGDANLVVPDPWQGDTLLTTFAATPLGLTASDPVAPTPNPEPATLSLVLLGGAGLIRAIRRQRASA